MSFGDALRKAAAGGDDYDPPNGTHQTRIVDTATYRGGDGREWCKVIHEIISGPGEAGRRFEHFGPAGDHNPVGFELMAQALVLYGVDLDNVEDLDDLGRAMFEVIGNTVDLSIGHKNGYLQVRVQGSRTGKSDIPSNGGNGGGFADRVGQTAAKAYETVVDRETGEEIPVRKADDEEIPF